MKLLQRVLAVATAVLALATAPVAAQPPNLSGTWELDVAQSSFGMMPGPQKATMVVEHREPALRVATTTVTPRGERTSTNSYTTDGKESRNAGAMGNAMSSTLRWDGRVLVNASKTRMRENDISIDERWTVADDGRTLTIARKVATPMGEMEQKAVYRKQ